MPETAIDKAFTTVDVSFAAGDRTLLGPVSLELERGRVYGLIGHNGSGKTTLVKLLARQQAPSAGTISFAGRPLSRWGRASSPARSPTCRRPPRPRPVSRSASWPRSAATPGTARSAASGPTTAATSRKRSS